jgi:putative hemolysin
VRKSFENLNLLSVTDEEDVKSRGFSRIVEKAMQSVLRLPQIHGVYGQVRCAEGQGEFLDRTLKVVNVALDIGGPGRGDIPVDGPLIVVANHPYGGLEGIILAKILLAVRKDVRMLANYLLQGVPDLKDLFISVDPFVSAGPSVRRNVAGLRGALAWLQKSGALIIFPAGEVAHLQFRKGVVSDPSWTDSVGWLARRTGATVFPAFFSGRNSTFF